MFSGISCPALLTTIFQIFIHIVLCGAGGARTHDRQIMSPVVRHATSWMSTCVDVPFAAAFPCHLTTYSPRPRSALANRDELAKVGPRLWVKTW